MTVVDEGQGAAGHELAPEHRAEAERALEVLLDASLEPIVDMVFVHRDGAYEALAHDGAVRFRREDDGSFKVLSRAGADPLARQDPGAFAGLDAERAHLHPHRRDNSYPDAFAQVAQLFDSPAAPDLCVQHSAGHNWEDQGGHLGEHGSLGVIQARAPFVIAGKGVRERGLIDAAARLVDVAPTVAELIGCAPLAGDRPRYLTVQDGAARSEVLDAAVRPAHVIGFLFDGANANVLYAMAASGEAPNVARLMEMGTSFGQGALSNLPTVTLANHTSILTGSCPGHHGILHNAWYDRAARTQVITNSPATWPWAMSNLSTGVDSLHTAVHRTFHDVFTASVNEPCDLGADYSTFDFMRRGDVPPIPETPIGLPHVTERFVRPSKDYAWSSVVDHMAVEQACGVLSGSYRGETYPAPRLMFVNFTLTDAAMHDGGPHSEIAAASIRDSDARVGEILAAAESAGIFDDCAFFLVADHGMEETDRACRGDWGVALSEAGVTVRDEAYGFLYFGI